MKEWWWNGISPVKAVSKEKRLIRQALKEAHFSNIKFNQGHYYFSGFAEKNYKIIYFSISDVRHFPNDNSVLIRTAKHTKDWTGGSNNYAERNHESIKELANKLIKE